MKINTERLAELIKQAGGFVAVQDASKGTDDKRRITARTLYNLVEGQGWRSETVNVVCEILGIHPSEIVIFENGNNHDTHASSQPVKDLEQVGEPA